MDFFSPPKNLFLCFYTGELQLGIIIPFKVFFLNNIAAIHVSFTAFSELF